ncbi:MAG: Nickel transporter UreH [Myxococcales bacterium]|nr:Nickel transporter UreH [Myxococcales bacterium]
MLTALTAGLAGLVLGLRHALEPDHLAAVSTMVAERPGARRGLRLGAAWGLGHTLALLAVGATLALLQVSLPPRVADAFELGVAVMLIVLGARAVLVRKRAVTRPLRPARVERRSLVVGLVHGLAGSGALTALVMATLPTTAQRLGYIALFGLGSVVGMALLSSLAGWPLERLQGRLGWLSAAAGLVAAGVGVAWGWPILVRLV